MRGASFQVFSFNLWLRLSRAACAAVFLAAAAGHADVTIAHISDTHLGEKHSPQAADHLREIVALINARHPDVAIVSGDIGETRENREEAKTILKALTAPVYYVPGNHDVSNARDLESYRKDFGPDYYRFQVKGVEVVALDSQLLGNYEKFGPGPLPPLSPNMEAESKKMLDWMATLSESTTGKIVVAFQHVPLFRDGSFPDAKPYWIVNAPCAQMETDLLHKLGVRHLLAGHWHNGRVFEKDGLRIHVAPSTSWLPFGGQLGFALHTVNSGGEMHTEFVALQAKGTR